jgi:prevent-host-death family protein
MRIASLADVKAKLSAYVDRSAKEGPIIITRNGKPVAVLVSPRDDDDLENLVLARSPAFLARIERARRSVRQGKGLTEEEFWKAVDKGEPSPRSSGRSS